MFQIKDKGIKSLAWAVITFLLYAPFVYFDEKAGIFSGLEKSLPFFILFFISAMISIESGLMCVFYENRNAPGYVGLSVSILLLALTATKIHVYFLIIYIVFADLMR